MKILPISIPDKYKFPVIEDAAKALGSRYMDKQGLKFTRYAQRRYPQREEKRVYYFVNGLKQRP